MRSLPRHPLTLAPRRPAFLRPLVAALGLAWGLSGLAWADAAPEATAEAAPPQLRGSPALQETLTPEERKQRPVFVSSDRLEGQTDAKAVLEGNAELRRADTVIRADRVEYTVPDDLARAQGKVHINRAGNRYEGTALELKVDAFEGFFDDAQFRLLKTGAHGGASRVEFLDADRSIIHHATYTTCQKNDEASWQPDWVLRAKTLRLDNLEEVGVAEDVTLEFKGMALPAIPSISFPLSDKRKSGLLPPTIAIDSRSGVEYAQPWYWNIAPNRDATLNAAIKSKRGVSLGGEFRYLEPHYKGQTLADWMPNDALRDRQRWSLSGQHQGQLDSPIGGLGLNLNLQRVSDDDYWRDFPRATQPLRQRLLPGDAQLNWAQNDQSARLRVLKWQTLQDLASPILPPYDRMPQLQWRYAPTQLGAGLEASVELDTTRFEAARSALRNQANGQRSYAMAQIRRPFVRPGGFITPRLQLHTTHYELDGAMANGSRSASRSLPTFSLDSGLVFERDASYLGRNFVQTLEPRAFYTYTPFRDQSALPVYDTAANDFNFATIYTENAYGGHDRLADNNLLTVGASTRLLDPGTGAEAARFGIAQRVRFSDQRVTLPGEAPINDRLSDLMLGAGLQWTPAWGLDATVQYNPKTNRSIRSTIGTRYRAGPYQSLSVAYRLQRDISEQLQLGWQWPLSGPSNAPKGEARRWYSVGRLNYSLQERKFVDTVVGLEYDSCCWIGRVVLERLQSGLITSANTRLLFQVEFVGFSRLSLGSSPLETLRRNVPGYELLREDVRTPSRFSQYD